MDTVPILMILGVDQQALPARRIITCRFWQKYFQKKQEYPYAGNIIKNKKDLKAAESWDCMKEK